MCFPNMHWQRTNRMHSLTWHSTLGSLSTHCCKYVYILKMIKSPWQKTWRKIRTVS